MPITTDRRKIKKVSNQRLGYDAWHHDQNTPCDMDIVVEGLAAVQSVATSLPGALDPTKTVNQNYAAALRDVGKPADRDGIFGGSSARARAYVSRMVTLYYLLNEEV